MKTTCLLILVLFSLLIAASAIDNNDNLAEGLKPYGSFHGGGHCPAIDHIDGMIGTVVDAAETKVGLAMQDLVHCKLNTINRCAAGLPCLDIPEQVHFIHAQGRAYSYCVPHPALRLIGRLSICFRSRLSCRSAAT